jgi:ribonuclease PH
VALAEALDHLKVSGRLEEIPLRDTVAAVSVGLVDGKPYLDLCYEEDARAEVDANFAMTGQGLWVEIQGTAENEPFSTAAMGEMMKLGTKGIEQLMRAQKAALEGVALRF